jgi:hypothetical protein
MKLSSNRWDQFKVHNIGVPMQQIICLSVIALFMFVSALSAQTSSQQPTQEQLRELENAQKQRSSTAQVGQPNTGDGNSNPDKVGGTPSNNTPRTDNSGTHGGGAPQPTRPPSSRQIHGSSSDSRHQSNQSSGTSIHPENPNK